MTNGEFAAMLCPGWMLGVISGNAPDVTGWEVANVFPNGGGNWGGSYLTDPGQRRQRRGGPAARRLADRSRAAGQGVRRGRHVPEPDRAAYEDPALTDFVNPYFNDAPTGAIFAERAEAVTVAPYKDADYFKYHQALQDAVTRVFDGIEDQATSWDTYVAEVEAF